MHQQEIQFFWPLTEQWNLDLDFAPCVAYEKEKRKKLISDSVVSAGSYLIANGHGVGAAWATIDTNNVFRFKPDPEAVGYWELNKELQVWRKERPNKLHQKMTKIFFGWEWKDK